MIDIHTHLHPPRLFRAIRRWFAENSGWHLTHPAEPHDIAEALRSYGVERFVFCSYAHKPGMARDINTWLAQASRDLDGFGLPLGTVHLADEDCAEYYAAALKDGCIGLKIHEDVQKLSIDDERFDPIHALTVAHRGFVLVHMGPIPWQANSNNGPARLKKVLDKFPDLRVVVAHLGTPDTAAFLALSKQYKHLYIDTTMALSTKSPLHYPVDPEMLAAHADRILFGSDFPNIPHDHDVESGAIKDLPISDHYKRMMLSENARALLAAHLAKTTQHGMLHQCKDHP